MKIEIFGKDCYKIFINKEYVKNIDIKNRDELVKYIKEFLCKLKIRLYLHGFYKVKVFPQEKVGIFLDVIKLDDSDFSSNLDLRVVIYMDEKFYFETNDYFIIEECNDKRFLNGLFYCVVDDQFNEVLNYCEFGRFIYGKDVNKLLNNSIIL